MTASSFVLATGDATIHGFRLVDGDLVPVEGAERSLSTPDGAEVGSRLMDARSSRPSAAATSSPPSQSAWTGCSASR